jgi:hypothetical protein
MASQNISLFIQINSLKRSSDFGSRWNRPQSPGSSAALKGVEKFAPITWTGYIRMIEVYSDADQIQSSEEEKYPLNAVLLL